MPELVAPDPSLPYSGVLFICIHPARFAQRRNASILFHRTCLSNVYTELVAMNYVDKVMNAFKTPVLLCNRWEQ